MVPCFGSTSRSRHQRKAHALSQHCAVYVLMAYSVFLLPSTRTFVVHAISVQPPHLGHHTAAARTVTPHRSPAAGASSPAAWPLPVSTPRRTP